MKLYLITFCIISTVLNAVEAQNWNSLPGAPYSLYNRQDDMHFINADTGWVVNVEGDVYRTANGGISWDTLMFGTTIRCRSVGFLNNQTGILGNFGDYTGSPVVIDTNALFKTVDGGQSWSPVTNFNGPKPKGICGISVVSDSVVMAVGRISGDPIFLKSTDGGATFNSTDMSPWTSGLVDCYFISPDSGWVVGKSPNSTYATSVATVLFTYDGGQSWQTIFSGGSVGRWCWKICFPSKLTGYISVENHWQLGNLDTNYVLKTTDGGMTWQQLMVDISTNRLQGIGFVNDSVGWTGEEWVRKTINGGLTWQISTDLRFFNRYRNVNDSVKYAAGQTISKFQNTNTGIDDSYAADEKILELQGNPNPFIKSFEATCTVKVNGMLSFFIYDFAGLPVYKSQPEFKQPGSYSRTFDLKQLPSGVYYLVAAIANERQSIKLIKQ